MTTAVYLELGPKAKKVFACPVEWPGWERPGRGEAEALAALAAHAGRYAAVAGASPSTDFDVVERVAGTATTDFGAPDAIPACDRRPLDDRWLTILEAAWAAFDEAVVRSTPTLRKGPRGGGRDRDAIVDHVREAERAYGRRLGTKVPTGVPWDEQRALLLDALQRAPLDGRWPPRAALRRITWHVLDHAWEIEDKQTS